MYNFQSSDPKATVRTVLWSFCNLLSQRKAQRKGPVGLVRSLLWGLGGERRTRALAPGPAFQHVFIEV